ncbi:mannose-1-phosphate guanylyltransferase/mannose-6-phosphate isomerase [Xanthobacter pseudotagetidis]|uniref:mannose-1-phosphate guanylyltransferase/mannose-6-phosphate isomerase n=1 Tax=Xanthobacter pseudotagetidis TaxID=3119911 RepID=UPI00372899A1
MKIVPVILAGGTGTRLWPLSRNSLPKQFLPLNSNYSLFQETLLRAAPGADFADPVVITSHDYRFYAQRQALEIGINPTVILEPARRDSAPAVVAATAYVASQHGPEALVLVLASDHVVLEADKFRASVFVAARAAALGNIVTFGIAPDRPRTSYGYIDVGEPLAVEGAFKVRAFVEKPDAATAEKYVDAGYLWNSGNFVFPANVMLSEAEAFEPEIARCAISAVEQAQVDIGFLKLDAAAFEAAPAKSIDFAVMERTSKAAVVKGDFTWSDVGSWDAVYEIGTADEAGNVTKGPVTLIDSDGNYVRSDGPLVAGVGIENLAVIATEDAVLVMPANRSQDVKALVAALKSARRNEVESHNKVYRPWGSYESVCRGERFQVKKIVVEPSGTLSLQKHHHRAEHWVVVRGTAEVTVGESVKTVNENESVYIPMGSVHRLANPGRIPLELIEVQTGSYLGEDDIVRLEDIYQRV